MTTELQIPIEQQILEIMKSLNSLQQQCIEALQTLPKRAIACDKEMESRVLEGIEAAARQNLEIKKDKFTIRQNAKKLYGLHIKPIIKQARQNLKGDIFDRTCTGLSIIGKLWDGVSIFWDELSAKHTSLKIFDNLIVRPMSVILYSRIVPELTIIKSAEFIGRSIKALKKAEKGKKWESVINVAKQMSKEIAIRFDRMAFGSPVPQIVSALSSQTSIKEETLSSLVQAITVSRGFDKLDRNTAIAVALSVAANGKPNQNLEELLEQALDVTIHPTKYPQATFQSFVDNMAGKMQHHLNSKISAIAKTIDSSLGVEEAIKLIKKTNTLGKAEKDTIIQSMIEFSLSKNLQSKNTLTNVDKLNLQRSIVTRERAMTI